MAANCAGTLGTYSVHVINQKNVINAHSNHVILPVLTSRHTQREQTIVYPTIAIDSGIAQRRLVTLLIYYRTHIPDDVSTYSFART